MADSHLTQHEADALLAMEKICQEDKTYTYPEPGGKLTIPLSSTDGRERFFLDVCRGRIDLSKVTQQHRARHVVVLLRLDLGGPPHQNPNGDKIGCPHLHIYQEGYADKWAFAVPAERYSDLDNLPQTLIEFMRHCNIAVAPTLQARLF